jgi:hypothetical protein
VVALPLPVSLMRQPKFADGFLIHESTSTVTVTAFAVFPVVPVVNVFVGEPYESDCAAVQVNDVVHDVSTGVTVIVRPAGVDVMKSVRVAVSAPPVVGIAQLVRSNRMNVQSTPPLFVRVSIVVALPLVPFGVACVT